MGMFWEIEKRAAFLNIFLQYLLFQYQKYVAHQFLQFSSGNRYR